MIFIPQAVFLPWELGKKADSLVSAPAGIKPEWYFLANYQLLKVMPAKILFIPGELVGIIVFSLAGLVWMLVPFWDTMIVERKRDKIINLVGGVGLFVMIALTIWGYLS